MTTITAKVIEDSISPLDIRLTTLQLRYPRFIHSEFMTHRMFSRNSSSSRAIPVERLIDDIERDPAEPIRWGKNQKGMKARKDLEDENAEQAKAVWRADRESSIAHARELAKIGGHKQLVNRLIENHGHINVVCTATEWNNFLYLRNHPDAQPEIEALAQAISIALDESQPVPREYGEWHLPYVNKDERDTFSRHELLAASTARCARVSYLTFEGKAPDLENDLRLYRELVETDPKHASPAEHQASPWKRMDFIRNFKGWRMHRATLPKDTVW